MISKVGEKIYKLGKMSLKQIFSRCKARKVQFKKDEFLPKNAIFQSKI